MRWFTSRPSEAAFASVTVPMTASAKRRRGAEWSVARLGVTAMRATNSNASTAGSSQEGPGVTRSGCTKPMTMVAATASCAGQYASPCSRRSATRAASSCTREACREPYVVDRRLLGT